MSTSLILGNYRPHALNLPADTRTVWCIDSETTGLSAKNGDRIITLGAVELFLDGPLNQMLGRSFEWKCNPGRPSDPDALRVHGIADETAATYPPFGEHVDEIINTLGSEILVAYNASFDIGFINLELGLLDQPPLGNFIYDPLPDIQAGLPHRASARLDDIMKQFAITSERELHGALKDAVMLAEVVRRMVDTAKILSLDLKDRDYFLKSSEIEPLPFRADRQLKQPTADEIAKHNNFLKFV